MTWESVGTLQLPIFSNIRDSIITLIKNYLRHPKDKTVKTVRMKATSREGYNLSSSICYICRLFKLYITITILYFTCLCGFGLQNISCLHTKLTTADRHFRPGKYRRHALAYIINKILKVMIGLQVVQQHSLFPQVLLIQKLFPLVSKT